MLLEEYETANNLLEIALQKKDQYMSLPKWQACRELAYYKTNNHRKAQIIINQLIERSKVDPSGCPEYFIGWYFSGINEVDSSFYWLEEAFNKRSPEMPWLKVDPVLKNIRYDPRFNDLYERTGHKAYDEYRTGLKE